MPHGIASRLSSSLVGALLFVLFASAPAPAQTASDQREALRALAARDGSVRVIAHLNLATLYEHDLAVPQEIQRQRRHLASAMDGVRRRLTGSGLRRFEPIEGMPAGVIELDAAGLEQLLADPAVKHVALDRLSRPLLQDSVPLIGGPQVWATGANGSGQMVAIVDTGVDRTHPFLGGRVAEEMCFSTTYSPDGATTLCPNGQTSQVGTGSGVNCAATLSGCEHGTHVAGIAAGYQSQSFAGVAPGAEILSAQVFSRFAKAQCGSGATADCVASYDSDMIRALQRIYALRNTYRIAAVNMSLGGGLYTDQQACDDDNVTMKASIDALRAAGIATVIAAGNDGAANAVSTPGCISSAFAVGSTQKNDTVSGFSNSASFVSLLAPGGAIRSSVPGGGFAVLSGTSMATPHVAGAFTLLRSARAGDTVDQIARSLAFAGRKIAFSIRIGQQTFSYTLPRIDVFGALSTIDGIPPTPETGWWWNPAESGRGYAIEVRGSNLFFGVFLYDDAGNSTWYVSSGPMTTANTYQGTILPYSGGQTLTGAYRAPAALGTAGQMSLQFSGARTATLVWPGGTIALQRFAFGQNGVDTPRQPFQPENGWWWNASESGRGFAIEVQGNQLFMTGFMYRSQGSPVWYLSQGPMIDDFTYQGTFTEFAGGQSLTGAYRGPQAMQTLGTVTVQFATTQAGRLMLPNGSIIPIQRFRF